MCVVSDQTPLQHVAGQSSCPDSAQWLPSGQEQEQGTFEQIREQVVPEQGTRNSASPCLAGFSPHFLFFVFQSSFSTVPERNSLLGLDAGVLSPSAYILTFINPEQCSVDDVDDSVGNVCMAICLLRSECQQSKLMPRRQHRKGRDLDVEVSGLMLQRTFFPSLTSSFKIGVCIFASQQSFLQGDRRSGCRSEHWRAFRAKLIRKLSTLPSGSRVSRLLITKQKGAAWQEK